MTKLEKKNKKITYRTNKKIIAAAVLSAALLTGQIQPVTAQSESSVIKLSSLIPDNITIDSPVALSEISLPGSEYGTLSWVDSSCVPSSRVESFEVVFRPSGAVDLSRISGWDGESDAIYSTVTVVVSSMSEEYDEYEEEEEISENSGEETETPEEDGAEADDGDSYGGEETPSDMPEQDAEETKEPETDTDTGVTPETSEAPEETEETEKAPEETEETEKAPEETGETEKAPETTEEAEGSEGAEKVPEGTEDAEKTEDPNENGTAEEQVNPSKVAPEAGDTPDSSEETDTGENPEATEAPEQGEAPDDTKTEETENIFDRPIERPEDDKRPATVEDNLSAEEQEQLAEENHSCNGIYVSGIHLPWYVQFRASNGDSYEFTNEEEANIFKSYEFELWDLKNDTEYSIPDGEYISVTVPVKSGYEYTIEHLLDNGSMETIIPSVDGDTMIFSTHSFSPFGIAGSKPLVGGDISDNSYQNKTTPAAQATAVPAKKPSGSTTSNGSSSQQNGSQSSGSNMQQSAGQTSGSGSGAGTASDTSYQNQNGESNSSQSVNTGDNTVIYPFVILVIAAVLIIGIVVFLKKRK